MNPLVTPTSLAALAVGLLLTTACKDKKVEPAPVPVVENAMTYRLSGFAIKATAVQASYTSNQLSVTGITTPQSLSLELPNATTSGSVANGVLTYSTTGAVWSSSPAVGGSSIVELSELNLATRKASGTFTATLQPLPGTTATGSKTITDGTFISVSF